MTTDSKPHSRPPVEIVREALEHVRYDERDGYTLRLVQESFDSLVEQLETAQDALDRIADSKKHDKAHEGYCGWCHLIDIARAANDRYPASEPVDMEPPPSVFESDMSFRSPREQRRARKASNQDSEPEEA